MKSWILSLCLAWVTVGLAYAQPTIELVTQPQVPYVYVDAKGKPTGGIALETVACSMQGMGLSFSIRSVAWARAQRQVDMGKAAGFFPASRNTERDQWAVFAGPIAPQEWRWYLRRDNPMQPMDPSFKAGAMVTAYHGSNMASWLTANHYRVLDNPLSHDQLLGVLLNKRVDAVLAANISMEELIHKAGAAGKVRSVMLANRPLGIYFSKQFLATQPKDFVERFNNKAAHCRSGMVK